MPQMLIFGLPASLVLACGLLFLVLLALVWAAAAMRRAAPRGPEREPMEAFGPDDETLFRLGRLEIAPLGERARHYR